MRQACTSSYARLNRTPVCTKSFHYRCLHQRPKAIPIVAPATPHDITPYTRSRSAAVAAKSTSRDLPGTTSTTTTSNSRGPEAQQALATSSASASMSSASTASRNAPGGQAGAPGLASTATSQQQLMPQGGPGPRPVPILTNGVPGGAAGSPASVIPLVLQSGAVVAPDMNYTVGAAVPWEMGACRGACKEGAEGWGARAQVVLQAGAVVAPDSNHTVGAAVRVGWDCAGGQEGKGAGGKGRGPWSRCRRAGAPGYELHGGSAVPGCGGVEWEGRRVERGREREGAGGEGPRVLLILRSIRPVPLRTRTMGREKSAGRGTARTT